MTKTVWTLDVDDYAPEITAITHSYLCRYAEKIGAEFRIISERKFPEFAPTYEKLQLFELGRESDWNIYFDSDCLIHPDFFDVTEHLSKDTVMHNAIDLAGWRWRYDEFFRRDGRHISSCNWFTVASNWCLDLWRPLDDLNYAQALYNVQPIQCEISRGITREHLVDDYVLSRNIARFGLKFKTLRDLLVELKRPEPSSEYLWHEYTITNEEKVLKLKEVLRRWNLPIIELVKTWLA